MKIPHWLKLQEEIDYLYFALGQYREQLPTSVLDKMIDDHTGHTSDMVKDIKEIIERMKKLKAEWGKETGVKVSTEAEDEFLELIKKKE